MDQEAAGDEGDAGTCLPVGAPVWSHSAFDIVAEGGDRVTFVPRSVDLKDRQLPAYFDDEYAPAAPCPACCLLMLHSAFRLRVVFLVARFEFEPRMAPLLLKNMLSTLFEKQQQAAAAGAGAAAAAKQA